MNTTLNKKIPILMVIIFFLFALTGCALGYMCYLAGVNAGMLEILQEEHQQIEANWFKEYRLKKTFEME